MTKLHSYSSPFTVGHKALARYEDRPGLFEMEVFVEEKVDGSQISFGLVEGDVRFRSRKVEIFAVDPGMFKNAVEAVLERKEFLVEGYVYRAEYLAKPKHNTLCYDRVPKNYLMVFDVETSPNYFMHHAERTKEADRIGFEPVPVLFEGKVEGIDHLRSFLDRTSVLGGPIEGIVIKPKDHMLWGQDKKVLMAKFVREDFKEKHEKEWRVGNPTKKDIVLEIIETYRTPQRWNKAVQHLREEGRLEDAVQDIGPLIKEVPADVLGDSKEEIKEKLFQFFWKQIARGITKGLPEWYKEKLLADAFDNPKEFVAHESVLAEEGTGAKPK